MKISNFKTFVWEAKIFGSCGYVHFEKLYFLNDSTIFTTQRPVLYTSVFALQCLFDNLKYDRPCNNLYDYSENRIFWKAGQDSSIFGARLYLDNKILKLEQESH